MEMNSRLAFIDNAKAIGIILVVFAHLKGAPGYLVDFIYSFHMPLFFFLSGYLLSDYKLSLKFKDYVWFQIKSLIFPYFFFGCLSILFFTLENKVKHNPIDVMNNLTGLIYGVGQGLVFNVVLWFFTCLFSVMIIYYIISRWGSKKKVFILSFVLGSLIAYSSTFFSFRLPWNMELAFVALVYFSLGNYLASIHVIRTLTNNVRVAVMCLSLLLCIYLSLQNGRVDMNGMGFNNIFLFFSSGITGILFIISLSSLLPMSKAALFLSKNTIIVFPTHLLFFSIFTAVGIFVFHEHYGFQNSLEFAIIYTALSFILSVPVSFIIKKYFSTLVGGRKVKKI